MSGARCGLKNSRHAPRRRLIDGVIAVFFLAPFRCRNCRHRFFRFSKRIGNDFTLAHSESPPSTPARPHVEEERSTALPPEQPAPDQPAPEQPAIEIETAGSILIIDSDPAIRKFLRRVLERYGYRTSELDDAKNLVPEL